MTIQNFPYRRELRPSQAESLGEHSDREFEKIEQAIANLERRLSALEPPSGS